MSFSLKNIRIKGFTLVEVLLVCSVFAIMVVGIILAVNRSYVFMNNIRLQVRATNFAREGVEMVFNIRDTNRRRKSGEKDKYRISNGYSGYINSSNQKALDGGILMEGIYVLKEKTTGSGDTYFYASGLIFGDNNTTSRLKIDNFYNDGNDGFWSSTATGESYRNAAKLTFSGTYYYPETDSNGVIYMETGSIQDLLGSEADFYRILRVYGVYCKNANSSNNTSTCDKDSDPKELRFCVKVFYRNLGDPHSTELCSIMTNFEE